MPRAGPGGRRALSRPIFSQERRYLVDGDGVDDADDCADDCADAEAAGKGGGNGDSLLPFFVTIDTGEYTPPLLGECFRQRLDAGHALRDARRRRGGSLDAQALVCVLPSGSVGPSPPQRQ